MAKKGDEKHAALKAAFEEFYEPLFHYAYSIVMRREEAKEAVQDAFVSLAQRGSAEIRNLGPWLFTVTRNKCYDRLTEHSRTSELDPGDLEQQPSPARSPKQEAEISEQVSKARRKMSQLPPKQREVLELIFFQQFSPEEAGEVMGIKRNAVDQLKYKALKNLRRLMDAEE